MSVGGSPSPLENLARDTSLAVESAMHILVGMLDSIGKINNISVINDPDVAHVNILNDALQFVEIIEGAVKKLHASIDSTPLQSRLSKAPYLMNLQVRNLHEALNLRSEYDEGSEI